MVTYFEMSTAGTYNCLALNMQILLSKSLLLFSTVFNIVINIKNVNDFQSK